MEEFTNLTIDDLGKIPGTQAVQEKLLQKALEFHKKFLDQKSDDPEVRAETGKGYQRAADIHRMLGNYGTAREAYENARTLFEKLVAAFPDNPSYQEDLAGCHNNLANLLFQDLRDVPAAEKAAEAALQLRRRLVARWPGVPRFQQGLAASYNNLGNLRQDVDPERAADDYRQAIQWQENLVRAAPTNAVYLEELGRTQNNLLDVLSATDSIAEAEALAARSRACFDQLKQLAAYHAGVPDPDYRFELAISYTHRGNLWREAKPAEAEACYQQARALGEQLMAQSPHVPFFREELAATYNNLGILLQATGRVLEAEDAYRRAVALKKGLADRFPKPDFQKELAKSYNNLGLLLQAYDPEEDGFERSALAAGTVGIVAFPPGTGLAALAVECIKSRSGAALAYGKALDILTDLVARFPHNSAYGHELARTRLNHATLLEANNQGPEAEQEYRAALAIGQEETASSRERPEYTDRRARTYLDRGLLFQAEGRFQEAEADYRKAVDLWAQLNSRARNEVSAYRHDLAVAHTNLANLLRVTGRAPEAVAHLRQAANLFDELKQKLPQIPGYRQEQARTYNELGICLADADPVEAEKSFRKALTVQELLVSDFRGKPEVVRYQQELARTHDNLGALLVKVTHLPETERRPEAEQNYRRAVQLLEEVRAPPPRARLPGGMT